MSTLSIIGLTPVSTTYAIHICPPGYTALHIDGNPAPVLCIASSQLDNFCEQSDNIFDECPSPEPEPCPDGEIRNDDGDCVPEEPDFKNQGQCVSKAAKIDDKEEKKEAMEACKQRD